MSFSSHKVNVLGQYFSILFFLLNIDSSDFRPQEETRKAVAVTKAKGEE